MLVFLTLLLLKKCLDVVFRLILSYGVKASVKDKEGS